MNEINMHLAILMKIFCQKIVSFVRSLNKFFFIQLYPDYFNFIVDVLYSKYVNGIEEVFDCKVKNCLAKNIFIRMVKIKLLGNFYIFISSCD